MEILTLQIINCSVIYIEYMSQFITHLFDYKVILLDFISQGYCLCQQEIEV